MPAIKPATRKIYIHHEVEVGVTTVQRAGKHIKEHKETRRRVERQWLRMNAQQRKEIVSLLKSARAADIEARKEEDSSDACRRKAHNMVQGYNPDDEDLFESWRLAMKAYDRIVEVYLAAGKAWSDLANAQEGLPNPNQISIAHSRTQATARGAQVEDLELSRSELDPEIWAGGDNVQHVRVPKLWDYHDMMRQREGRLRRDRSNQYFDENLNQLETSQGGHWEIVGLGKGHNGIARICVYVREGKIADRVVRKDVYLDNWHDARWWAYGDMSSDDNRMPWELECQRLLSAQQHDHVVKLRETDPARLQTWVDKARKMHRVYMEFCPHGDLRKLIEYYKQKKMQVEEAFIWNVAEGLAKAGIAMRDAQTGPPAKQIVHRDLTPRNVFLDTHGVDQYALEGMEYPQPRVGDFGSAICTSQHDERNPDEWITQVCCANGFRPPEIEQYFDWANGDLFPPAQLLEHTNVWQVGATLRSLITLDPHPPQPVWIGTYHSSKTLLDSHDKNEHRSYSRELLALIDECMRFNADDRPTFDEILEDINDLLPFPQHESTGPLYAAALMRHNLESHIEAVDAHFTNYPAARRDEYRIGMSWSQDEPEDGMDGHDPGEEDDEEEGKIDVADDQNEVEEGDAHQEEAARSSETNG